MPESPELLMVELLGVLPHCRVCDGPATRRMDSFALLSSDEVLFCDAHGAGDVERYRCLTQMTYEDITQASFVRRCQSVRVMPDHGLITECEYHGAVEGFCQVVNERLNRNIKEGSTWVRVKPPSREELDAVSGGVPRLMPFTRVGSLATLLSVYYIADGTRMVDLQIGGDTAIYEFEAFTRAFVRAVAGDEWKLDRMTAFQ